MIAGGGGRRPASASCGGTPRRPGSSWATPARSALGGLIAGLAMATRTCCCCRSLGVLFVIITMTWSSRSSRSRPPASGCSGWSPLQHHFELAGWSEVNIVVRFWIIAGIGVAIGLGLFYSDFLAG